MPSSTDKTRVLTERIVKALRKSLSLSDDSCYAAIAPAYIEGQNDQVVQVCTGSEAKEGGGSGAQDGGGCLDRRKNWTLAIWWRLKLDMHSMSEQMLTEAAGSIEDFSDQVRDALAMTFLGDDMLTEPLRWESATTPQWYDVDEGVISRQIVISGPFAVDLPSRVTLVETDFL